MIQPCKSVLRDYQTYNKIKKDLDAQVAKRKSKQV